MAQTKKQTSKNARKCRRRYTFDHHAFTASTASLPTSVKPRSPSLHHIPFPFPPGFCSSKLPPSSRPARTCLITWNWETALLPRSREPLRQVGPRGELVPECFIEKETEVDEQRLGLKTKKWRLQEELLRRYCRVDYSRKYGCGPMVSPRREWDVAFMKFEEAFEDAQWEEEGLSNVQTLRVGDRWKLASGEVVSRKSILPRASSDQALRRKKEADDFAVKPVEESRVIESFVEPIRKHHGPQNSKESAMPLELDDASDGIEGEAIFNTLSENSLDYSSSGSEQVAGDLAVSEKAKDPAVGEAMNAAPPILGIISDFVPSEDNDFETGWIF